MMRVAALHAACCLGLIAVPGKDARAEPGEKVLGAAGLLVLPAFEPQSRTAFRLAAGGASGFAHYGVTGELALGLRFSWATYSGIIPDFDYSTSAGGVRGRLSHVGALYEPEVFLQYKLYSGYLIAPYIEVGAGYVWTTFTEAALLADDDQEYDVTVKDFGEGSVTLSVALTVDWRLWNFLGLGTGVKYTWVPNGLLGHTFTVPLTASYYWW
jgi:hypothetical protein